MPSRERVREFVSAVERGDYVKAIEDFYHPNATLQENGQPPRVGQQALVDHERKVLAGLKGMRTRRVETYLVDGDRVVINWAIEMTGQDGQRG
jgi:ketosteroid isomerase-like protein